MENVSSDNSFPNYRDFQICHLNNYCYELSKYGKLYDDLNEREYYGRIGSYGLDIDGNIYHYPELAYMDKEVKIFNRMLVFIKESESYPSYPYIGTIQEMPDNSWTARSIKFPLDITGFLDQVHAVYFLRNLQKISDGRYRLDNTRCKDIPVQNNLSSLQYSDTYKILEIDNEYISYQNVVGFEILDDEDSYLVNSSRVLLDELTLGYVQCKSDNVWAAISTLASITLRNVRIYGFSDISYAVRYLHQVAFSGGHDHLIAIPKLPWEFNDADCK